MGVRNRIVLGRYQDVAESAALIADAPHAETESRQRDIELIEDALVARVRRQLGNKCAKVFLAYLHGRSWRKTRLPKRTFYYALKKVKNYFGADEYWVKLTSARKRKGQRLH